MLGKRYCYVDESGQDTLGRLFIVSVVIAAEDRDDILAFCEAVERATGKRSAKWRKTTPERRLAYITAILTAPYFAPIGGRSKLYTAIYHDTLSYLTCTTDTIIRALSIDSGFKAHEQIKDVIVLIDALPPSQSRIVGHRLRRAGIFVKKVRGIRRDENDALVRLADAICGFTRDFIESTPRLSELYAWAIRNLVIRLE